MQPQDLLSLSLPDLRLKAKSVGIKYSNTYRKADLVSKILSIIGTDSDVPYTAVPEDLTQDPDQPEYIAEAQEDTLCPSPSSKLPKKGTTPPLARESEQGILEVLPDGYGFIRSLTHLSGSSRDIYVSAIQIQRFSLKTGDLIY